MEKNRHLDLKGNFFWIFKLIRIFKKSLFQFGYLNFFLSSMRFISEISPSTYLTRLSLELDKPITSLKAVHIKGFGPNFTDDDCLFPLKALDQLLSADVVVFDGDDFSENDFTRSIRDYLKTKKQASRLLAFKFADEIESHFIPAWSKCIFPDTDDAELAYIAVSRNDVNASRHLYDIDAAEAFVLSTSKESFIPHFSKDNLLNNLFEPLRASQVEYVALGTFAIEQMRKAGARVSVVSWGGWLVVGYEFIQNSILFSDNDNKVMWSYFHANRRNPESGIIQEGVLSKILKHPMLTHS